MRSWEVTEFGQPLAQALRATPQPRGDEVLVRVTHSGLCHTDLHIWEGYFELGGGKRLYVKDRGVRLPIAPGHEPFGTVQAQGEAARSSGALAVGERCIVYPWIGCGACPACARGLDNLCMAHRYMGVLSPGAFATHVQVPHSRYLVPAGDLDPAFAATLACSGLTAYSGVRKLELDSPTEWVLVIGCGGLGLMAVSILRGLGHERIVACDVDPRKLESARALGAAATVLLNRPEAAAELREATHGRLASAIDYVGTRETAEFALAALVKGGQLVVCGLFGGELPVSLAPLVQRAITLRGSYVGSLAELQEVVGMAQRGQVVAPPIEIRAPSQINDALVDMKAGGLQGRVVFDLSAESED